MYPIMYNTFDRDKKNENCGKLRSTWKLRKTLNCGTRKIADNPKIADHTKIAGKRNKAKNCVKR